MRADHGDRVWQIVSRNLNGFGTQRVAAWRQKVRTKCVESGLSKAQNSAQPVLMPVSLCFVHECAFLRAQFEENADAGLVERRLQIDLIRLIGSEGRVRQVEGS